MALEIPVEFRIEPDRSSPLRMLTRSLVDRNIGLDPSFLVVLANFPGIVGGICRDELSVIPKRRESQMLRGLARRDGNHG